MLHHILVKYNEQVKDKAALCRRSGRCSAIRWRFRAYMR